MTDLVDFGGRNRQPARLAGVTYETRCALAAIIRSSCFVVGKQRRGDRCCGFGSTMVFFDEQRIDLCFPRCDFSI